VGYCMSLMEQSFKMTAENEAQLREGAEKNPFLTKALDRFYSDWDPGYDDEGNIVELDFIEEKRADDHEFFHATAPYVEQGSYIQMRGEDGAMWRWVFKDGECKEIRPRIIW